MKEPQKHLLPKIMYKLSSKTMLELFRMHKNIIKLLRVILHRHMNVFFGNFLFLQILFNIFIKNCLQAFIKILIRRVDNLFKI